MYVFDYFLYHLRPYGISHNDGATTPKVIVEHAEKGATSRPYVHSHVDSARVSGHSSRNQSNSDTLTVVKSNQ